MSERELTDDEQLLWAFLETGDGAPKDRLAARAAFDRIVAREEEEPQEDGCKHEHFTTGELFDWCNFCSAHRMNATWHTSSRPWMSGEIVRRAPSNLDLLVRIEQVERRLERKINELDER